MAVKMTGATWKDFYSDPEFWPPGAWHEGETVILNGEEMIDMDVDFYEIDDCASLKIAGGVFYPSEDAVDGPTLEAHFKRWLKKQANTYFMVKTPTELADTVRAAIAAAGGKVV